MCVSCLVRLGIGHFLMVSAIRRRCVPVGWRFVTGRRNAFGSAFADARRTRPRPREGGREGTGHACDPGRRRRGERPTKTAGGSKDHLMEVAGRVQIRGRSRMTKAELVEAIQRANEVRTRESAERARR